MTEQDAFSAIADSNRRVLIEELRRGPRTVSQLSALLPDISRPAVSQHLKMLLDCKIVTVEAKGTSRIYALDGAGLVPVSIWIDQFWNI